MTCNIGWQNPRVILNDMYPVLVYSVQISSYFHFNALFYVFLSHSQGQGKKRNQALCLQPPPPLSRYNLAYEKETLFDSNL